MTTTDTTTETIATVTPINSDVAPADPQADAAKPKRASRASRAADKAKADTPAGDVEPHGEPLTDAERAELAAHVATLTEPAAPELPEGVVRATWKQHGSPAAFVFYGTAIKAPAPAGVTVTEVETDKQGVTLKAANDEPVEGGRFGFATKFWAVVADDAKGEAAKPARTPAERVARATTDAGDVPAGYLVLKHTASFDQFRKADATADGPDWLTRCNKHGNTTPADNRKAGRTLGSASARATWCKGCKADAAKAARETAKAEPATEPAAE